MTVAALTPMLGIPVSDSVKAVAPAIVVALVIYSIGDVSGAHINPAVTVAFALRRAFPWGRVPGYLMAQVAGAVIAAGVLRLWSSEAVEEGVNQPHVGAAAAFLVEAALTAFLVLVILNVATRKASSVPAPRSPSAWSSPSTACSA